MTTTVVLDSNIWDKLAVDHGAIECIRKLCDAGRLQVLIPHTLFLELAASPFGGVPPWFPTHEIADGVFLPNHSRPGHARPGDGKAFSAHLGDSNKIADAVIVDAADIDADLFVSEDNRARARYAALRNGARSLDYSAFRHAILGL